MAGPIAELRLWAVFNNLIGITKATVGNFFAHSRFLRLKN
jgi:hypothetical protein